MSRILATLFMAESGSLCVVERSRSLSKDDDEDEDEAGCAPYARARAMMHVPDVPAAILALRKVQQRNDGRLFVVGRVLGDDLLGLCG